MLTSQRRALISARLASDGQIIAGELAEELDLSEDTIRRDLRDMAAAGLLKRVHGGALPITPPLPDLEARQTISTDVKKRLGREAARLVRAGQLVFIDGGTTNAEIVRALPREMKLTITTHSPAIAALLEKHRAEVILIGGSLYKHSMVATGAAALAAIGMLRPDIFFLGATAIHPAHGLSTGDHEEAAVKRAIATQSAETITLLTEEKFNAVSPHRIMGVEEVAGLIVPAGMAQDVTAPYRQKAVRIIEG
ncbi:DeoR/GlpR family DNA-binding transcription regulator [Pararhizobium sp. BT-229]|uniref:DeoR/GlpR family DNA-binding transcription regulator n=1 Tax=Pararhizobium sp. BT-229 TaxID=2986923 RepID=UPI0021F741C9|nr:DeoR/GlpR family DNA-binding transcription regulator [Pararhizobium sp. BT-229]MCV9963336.1 DeoR/GlpR family DNA-binding transcription regulator [Pararhizobium sp. BT-229]